MKRPVALFAFTAVAPLMFAQSGRGSAHQFAENKGQWPIQVLYRTCTDGGALFVERNALTYVLVKNKPGHAGAGRSIRDDSTRMHAYRVTFEGAHALAHQGFGKLPQYENYFVGNDPRRWASRVSVYTTVEEEELYPRIDLRIDGATQLQYDLLLAAGADERRIAMRYQGQDALLLKDGRLVVKTTAGEVTEEAPVAWQTVNGKRMPVKCVYQLDGNVVRFGFPEGFDHTLALTIDPVLVFSSYVGSTSENFGYTATYDEGGNTYAGGVVFNVGYPTTLGVLQPAFAGGGLDIGLSKFRSDGTGLVWSTYLGGTQGQECPQSLVVNSNNELYMFGTTGSPDFPTSTGCFDSTFSIGAPVIYPFYSEAHFNQGADIVIVHLNADATGIIGSTFVGGSDADGLNLPNALAHNYGDPYRGEIILDQQQRPVIATSTASHDIPTTPGAPFPTFLGGAQDGYVFSMDTLLTSLRFATFFGGSLDDACYGIHMAGNGEVLATGGSTSADLPMPAPAFDATANGDVDGFIARFSSDGSSLLSSTYLGTAAFDQCYSIQTDDDGAVLVVGQTHGSYPITPGKYAVPGSSQFIHKLSPDLSTSDWSTVIGSGIGTEDISPTAFLLSACGQIYFCGWGGQFNWDGNALLSTTAGLPVTADAIQSTTDGSDFYLMVLQPEATALAYGTFWGGTESQEHVDGGTSRFNRSGIVYEAVCAKGGPNTFPTTPGAWCTQITNGLYNLAVFKMHTVAGGIDASIGPVGPACAPVDIQFQNTGDGVSWIWDFGDGSPASTANAPSHLYTDAGTYTVTLVAIDSASCNHSDTTSIQVVLNSSQPIVPTFTVQQVGGCYPFTVVLNNTTPGNGQTLLWDLGDGTITTVMTVAHTYASAGTYMISLTVTDTLCGGTGTAQIPVTITEPVPVQAMFSVATVGCSGLHVNTTNLSTGPQGLQYEWMLGDGSTSDSTFVSQLYSTPGVYTISLTAVDPLCGDSDTYQLQVTVQAAPPPLDSLLIPNVFSPNGDGYNETFFPIPYVDARTELRVYNRWGMKIYDTGGGGYVPWNGNAAPGARAPDSVYYYVLDYYPPCASGQPSLEKHGYVEVLR